MIFKNDIIYYSGLLKKKNRNQEKKFLIEGKKIISEALNSNFDIELLFVSNLFFEAETEFLKSIKKFKVPIEKIKTLELKKLSDTETQPGIIGVVNFPKFQALNKNAKVIVGLEKINDPGNLGTILRTCDWFGFNDVIISKESVDVFNSKVIRGSMGSIFHLNILQEVDIVEYCKKLKLLNYVILVADLDGNSDLPPLSETNICLIFSNESIGPSRELLSIASSKLSIPKFGNAESLNVASAAAVLMSQIRNSI